MSAETRHAATTAIYFPHIAVPQSPWFTQILLYWDKVASIVPEGLEHEDGRLNPYMQELHAAQLLDYVRPGEALSYRSGGDFGTGFIRILESQKPAPEEPRRFTKVHFDKMGYPLFLELQRRGLAQAIDGRGYDWWRIETTTAGAYMGYIACAISGARPGMTPVTDRLECLKTLDPQSNTVAQRLAHLRFSAISHALPAPDGVVSAAELIDFKDKNAELLRSCRTYLDDKLVELTTIDDPDVRAVRIDGALQAIKREVTVLTEQMERRRWPKVTLVGFGGLSAAALEGMSTLAQGGGALAMGLSFGAAVLGTMAAGYGALEMTREPRIDMTAPLAYAALARRL